MPSTRPLLFPNWLLIALLISPAYAGLDTGSAELNAVQPNLLPARSSTMMHWYSTLGISRGFKADDAALYAMKPTELTGVLAAD